MTLKAIDELSAAAARDRIARAIGVKREVIGLSWTGHRVTDILVTRKSETPRHLTEPELMAIAEAGVLLGADGWEIEEDPARYVESFGYVTAAEEAEIRGDAAIKPGDLFRSKQGGPVKKVVGPGPFDARDRGVRRWALTLQHPGESHIVGSSELEPDLLDPAKWERVTAEPAKPEKPTGTIIGERSPASSALRRLVLRALDRAEDGGMIDPLVYPGAAAHLSDLCDAFVSELRAELAPKPEPSPRAADGALTAYLLAHYRDEWRTDDTAEILAIRLLGETQRIVDEAHREAEASDANAKEMAAELAKVRAELNAANSRAAEAEHDRDEARKALLIEAKERDEARRAQRSATRERDEARADLTVLRGMIRGIAAKAGVPHG